MVNAIIPPHFQFPPSFPASAVPVSLHGPPAHLPRSTNLNCLPKIFHPD